MLVFPIDRNGTKCYSFVTVEIILAEFAKLCSLSLTLHAPK